MNESGPAICGRSARPHHRKIICDWPYTRWYTPTAPRKPLVELGGAGIFLAKSLDSKVGASHSLLVEEALLQAAPASPDAGIFFKKVSNSKVGAFHSLSVEEALLKAAPASPGAGIFFKKSSISTVGASHSLPVEEALL